MLKRNGILMIILGIVMTSCSGGISQPPPPSPDPNADVASYLDSSLPATEKDIIADFIRSLPSEVKSTTASIYLADTARSIVFSNRDYLRNTLAIRHPEQYSYLAAQPEYFGAASDAGTGHRVACTSRQTGAYWGQYTKGGDWERINSTVRIPESYKVNDLGSQYQSGVYKRDRNGQIIYVNGQPQYATGSEAYIYFGGWGGRNSSNARSAIDAGLKHNVRSTIDPNANNYKRFFEDWDVFIKLEGGFYVTGTDDYANQQANVRNRFKSGQDVKMTFGRSKSLKTHGEFLYVVVAGYDNFNNYNTVIVGMDINNYTNKLEAWNRGNTDLTFKRIISIAQTNSIIVDRVGQYNSPDKDFYMDGSRITEAGFFSTKLYDRSGRVYDMNDPLIDQGWCKVSPSTIYAWSPWSNSDVYVNINLDPGISTPGASITTPSAPRKGAY